MLTLSSPVTAVRMINDRYAATLEKLGITTVGDLLFHIPFRYDDYSQITKIAFLSPDQVVTVLGEIGECKNVYTKYGKAVQKATIRDETGTITVVWYNQSYLQKVLLPGTNVTIAGKVGFFDHKLAFQSPDYEIIREDADLLHSGRLVPVYPETKGITSKWLRSKLHTLFPLLVDHAPDPLPIETRQQYQLPGIPEALTLVHFPKTLEDAAKGKRRLAFDELVEIQLAALIRRQEWERKTIGHRFHISDHQEKIDQFIRSLPFMLTTAQQRSIREILADLERDTSMNRLLEGDVGSGKTVVAAVCMYATYLNRFSSVLMAPTEILAQQHYASIARLLEPLGIPMALVTGAKKTGLAETPHASTPGIFIGTHALIEEKIQIPYLGLVVIDEQQRFGVEQRAKLRAKGDNPHLLSMTATPIPRTVALTLHADLDLSVLDEMPQGRQKIKTWVVPPVKRSSAYEWIRRVILTPISHQGKNPEGISQTIRDPSSPTAPQDDMTHHQAFIICPLIEESESMTSVKSAKKEFETLQRDIFPDLSLGLVHGKMTAKEKDSVLQQFRDGTYHILVATPIVEVGIDIPAATVILIEAADRFGLAQLHQLRGRVGRSSLQSYCLLFTETDKEQTIAKLKLLETTHLGPVLAERDLELRGGGDLYGTKQHGAMDLKYADFSDLSLLHETRAAAKAILAKDPVLSTLPLLRERVQPYTIRDIAPD